MTKSNMVDVETVYVSVASGVIRAADRNHDRLLSKDEANAGHVTFIVASFDVIDKNHRRLVSKDDVHEFIKQALLRRQPISGSSSEKK